ncbi:hypothetical protein K8I28_12670 [bacterium]|nr:hypothetical protein [bacterium]
MAVVFGLGFIPRLIYPAIVLFLCHPGDELSRDPVALRHTRMAVVIGLGFIPSLINPAIVLFLCHPGDELSRDPEYFQRSFY